MKSPTTSALRSRSSESAQQVEGPLIKAFADHDKISNRALGAGGGVGTPPYFVYVAFWL